MCSTARPKLDNGVLTKVVFRYGECLLKHASYIVLLMTKKATTTTTTTTTTMNDHAQHPSKALVQLIVARFGPSGLLSG